MRTRDVVLDVNGQATDSQGGAVLICEAVSGASGECAVTWLDQGGQQRGTIQHVKPGRKYRPGFEFFGLRITGDAASSIRLLIGPHGADADLADQDVLITNDATQRVPVAQDPTILNVDRVKVDVGGGVINVTATDVGIIPNGVAITDDVAVAVTDVVTALVAADATRVSVRFFNQGPDAVAIGSPTLTWAKRTIVLNAGDSYIEHDAAALAMSAICDAGLTATVGVQEVTK